MKSAVLLLIFKREDTTRQVFERIREAQPPKLYIAADGPRIDRDGEAEKCQETRKIVDNVDWPCEVFHLYRDENLGCGRGVSSAITWFFENEEQGIIIEDDIVPHLDFFKYCDIMLEKYKHDDKIQLISGHNVIKQSNSEQSYYFSNLPMIWGWASWRRVWNTYELDSRKISYLTFISSLRKRGFALKYILHWLFMLKRMKFHKIDTWDYQFMFNMIVENRYAIIPNVNTTTNIGFDSFDAAHTVGENEFEKSNTALTPLPIVHPKIFDVNLNADIMYMEANHEYIGIRELYNMIKKKL